jgi:hypothetical protein
VKHPAPSSFEQRRKGWGWEWLQTCGWCVPRPSAFSAVAFAIPSLTLLFTFRNVCFSDPDFHIHRHYRIRACPVHFVPSTPTARIRCSSMNAAVQRSTPSTTLCHVSSRYTNPPQNTSHSGIITNTSPPTTPHSRSRRSPFPLSSLTSALRCPRSCMSHMRRT